MPEVGHDAPQQAGKGMAAKDQVLVADIGGTNARFAIVDRVGAGASIALKEASEADDHSSVADAALAFLRGAGVLPERAVFAVAAPVLGDEIVFTNSPWRFSQRDLAARLGLKSLLVVNDFAAMARGAVAADAADLGVIKEGKGAAAAPVVVLGPGTGLGAGIVFEADGRKIAVATQGGFAAFAPQDSREIEVLRFLSRELSYVSFEHVLSGRGLVNLYRALGEVENRRGALRQPEEITAAALDKSDSLAREATAVFCAVLGTFAGDACLMAGARGGCILAGGILPKIEAILSSSSFVRRFQSRDQMSDYMTDIPVWLLRTGDAALVGAALLAGE